MAIRLRERYDWVVLGDNTGALLSACLAARLGQSALVVPLMNLGRTARSATGQVLDPESNAVYGVRSKETGNSLSGLLWRCFDHLGVTKEEWEQLQVGAAVPQILTPTHRVLLSPSEKGLHHELVREFGSDTLQNSGISSAASKIETVAERYWDQYPEYLSLTQKEKEAKRPVEPLPRALPGDPSSVIQQFRKTAEKQNGTAGVEKRWLSEGSQLSAMASELGDISWQEVGAGIWNSLSEQETENPRSDELLQALMLARSALRVKGGMTAYRLWLASLARRLGVHVLNKNECRRIFIENGQFKGVQASGIPSMIAARAGAIDVPLYRVRDKIDFSGKHRLHDLKPGLPVTGWRYTIALTVSSSAIPPGAGNRLVWQEKNAPAVEIEISDPVEYSVTDPGQTLVFLRSTLPYARESLGREFLRMTSARMLRQAAEILPFLESHVIRVFPDFRANANDFEVISGLESLDDIPYNWLRFGPGGLGSRSGINSLALVSPESFPRLGQFGGTVAAVESAAWLAQASGINGPMAVQVSVT